MTEVALSIVVVTYRNEATVEACLAAIASSLTQAGVGARVVVVDNNSDDATVALTEGSGLADVVVRLERNQGFAAGCNVGTAQVDSECTVFVNPDAMVEPDAIHALLDAAERWPRAAVIGGAALSDNGAIDPRSVLPAPSLGSALAFAVGLSTAFPGRFDGGLPAGAREQQVPAVSGALMMARRAAWDALGGMDEQFRLYGEDVDLCVRAHKIGYQVVFAPSARAAHAVGGSTPSPVRQALVKAGQATLYRRHLPRGQAAVAQSALVVGTGLRAAAGRVWKPSRVRQGRPVTSADAWKGAWRSRRLWRRGWEGQEIGDVSGAAEGPSRPAVLIIIQNMPFALDRRVRAEAAALQDAGWTVSVICPRGENEPSSFVLDGVTVSTYPPPPPTKGETSFFVEFAYAWMQAARLSLRVRQRPGFQVLHGCNPPDTYWLLGWLWRVRGVRYVFDQHDLNPEVFEAKFGRRGGLLYRGLLALEQASYRTADLVISPNESYREIALTRGRVNRDKVRVVMSTPDADAMRAGEPDPGLKSGAEYLACYVGIMGPQDGLDRLVAAIDHYVNGLGRRDTHFALLGYGDSLEDARADVAARGLNDVVTFTGRVSHAEIGRWLSSADIGVTPDPKTRFNDLSTMNKTLEYMVHSLPVVATDLMETRRSAQDAAVYVLDEREMAQAIAELLDDPRRRRVMGEAGRVRIESTLSWTRQAEQLRAGYAQLTPTAALQAMRHYSTPTRSH